MAAGPRDGRDDRLADLGGEARQVCLADAAKVGGLVEPGENRGGHWRDDAPGCRVSETRSTSLDVTRRRRRVYVEPARLAGAGYSPGRTFRNAFQSGIGRVRSQAP